MTRRTAVVAAGVFLALMGAAAAVATGCGSDSLAGPSTDGPMEVVGDHGIVVVDERGTVFTDGLEVLRLEGTEPATIVSVNSVGGEDTFRYLGALVAGPDRRDGAVSYLRRFPPKDRALGELVEAVGAQIHPRSQTRHEKGYELLLGYEVTDDSQVGYRTAVEVVYRVGDKEYLWRSPGRILFCPEPMDSSECTTIAEGDNWGD